MNLTAVINNFKRPEYFVRCFESLLKHYPGISIIEMEEENLSIARNRGAKRAKTDFVLFCDDDMEFTKFSNLHALLELMKTADIAGGKVEGLMYEGRFKPADTTMTYVPITHDYMRYHGIQYQHADFIPNFFITKRIFLLNKPWDERMRISWEHIDFFLSAKRRGLTTVFCPDAIVKHDKSLPMSDEYLAYRNNDAGAKAAFFEKWGFEKIISMDGDVLQPDTIAV